MYQLLRFGALTGLAGIIFVALAGCNPQIGSVPPNEIPAVDLSTPRDSARTILILLQAELKAVALGDAKSLAEIRRRELEAADRDGIEALINPRHLHTTGKDPIEIVVNMWASVISYYADIIEYDAAREIAGTNPNLVVLNVPARGKSDETQLEIQTARGADGRWRVTKVGFARHAAPILVNTTLTPLPAPASQPASQPRSGG